MSPPTDDSDGGIDRCPSDSMKQLLQTGDDSAYQELFASYSEKLVRVAAKNIHPRLLKRFDGEDVVQSVFRTFFRRREESVLPIQDSQHLWRLLVRLTLLKTRTFSRRHTAECRDALADEGTLDVVQSLAREPGVEDAIALWEEIDAVLQGLPDRTAEIISLRLEGRNRSDIAVKLGVSRQTVYRILNLVQERLEQRLA